MHIHKQHSFNTIAPYADQMYSGPPKEYVQKEMETTAGFFAPVQESHRSPGINPEKTKDTTSGMNPAAPNPNPRIPSQSPKIQPPTEPLNVSTRRGRRVPPLERPSSKAVPVRSGQPALLLIDADLWSKFHSVQNEMIITKSGRCLFPTLRFMAMNLDPEALYSVSLDFELLDPTRYKFVDGQWKSTGPKTRSNAPSRLEGPSAISHDGRPSYPTQEAYMHPDFYKSGAHWMKGPVTFSKVKLTNQILKPLSRSTTKAASKKEAHNSHVFHLTSFHKYRPRVHLVQRCKDSRAVLCSTTYTFDRTTFMAVTHYQNYKVNDLKKDFNPHAKGFRESIGRVALTTTKSGQVRSSSTRLRTRKRSRWNRGSDVSESGDLDDDDEDDVIDINQRERSKCFPEGSEAEDEDEEDGDVEEVEEDEEKVQSRGDDQTHDHSLGEGEFILQNTIWQTRLARQGSSQTDASIATNLELQEGSPSPSELPIDISDEALNAMCRLDKENRTMVRISVAKDLLPGSMARGFKVSEKTSLHQFKHQHAPKHFMGKAPHLQAARDSRRALVEMSGNRPFHPAQTEPKVTRELDHRRSAPPAKANPSTGRRVKQRRSAIPPQKFSTQSPAHQGGPYKHSDPVRSQAGKSTPRTEGPLQLPSVPPMPAMPSLQESFLPAESSLEVSGQEFECGPLSSPSITPLSMAPLPTPMSWYQQFFVWDQSPMTFPPSCTSPGLVSPISQDTGYDISFPLDLNIRSTNSASDGIAPSSTQHVQAQSLATSPLMTLPDQLVTAESLANGVSTAAGGIHLLQHAAFNNPCSSYPGFSSEVPLPKTDQEISSLSDLGMQKATILESKTYMSTSSVASIMPPSGPLEQVDLRLALRENLRLKAFIRERYGPEAEAEANAVMAMECHQ